MDGGEGNDTFYVDNAFDRVFDSSSSTTETVRTSVSYSLPSTADVEIFETTHAAGSSPIDLTGNHGTQRIWGNDGANFLNGREGSDTLFGLGGADVFEFDTELNETPNVDTIDDFDPAAEYIYIDNAIFSGLAAEPGHFLPSNEFHAGAAAGGPDDRIIHDSSTGAIFYDSDGTGEAAQVQFAWVDAGLSLAHDNFHIF
jgi:Ca2+-binding RTX toxin-like protein